MQYIKLTVDNCLSQKEVADKLNKSIYTVSSQLKNIYRKLNISKVTELSKLYYTGAINAIVILSIGLHIHTKDIIRPQINRRNTRIEIQRGQRYTRKSQKGRNYMQSNNNQYTA